MKRFSNFKSAIGNARDMLYHTGHKVSTNRWQGVDVSAKPEMVMQELFNWCFSVPLIYKSLDHWREDIEPNWPWADRHFEEERVSGQPINPGETWKIWPYGHSADKFRTENGGQYNHTYAERYWPRYAGRTEGGILKEEPPKVPPAFEWESGPMQRQNPHMGIRYRYGDLNDLVSMLQKDPHTRQAYLPVWFPEDLSHDDRKPCSLGYHFILRGDYLHVNYYIRSCDIVRHFQDDIYLTIRLLLWVLDQLVKRDERWLQVIPGQFSMFITSLHCFVNDIPELGRWLKDSQNLNSKS